MLPFIDSDNAMGSPAGDVDDGFAVAALLLSGAPVAALASVRGNTSEPRAARNNRRLAGLCHFPGPFLRGTRSTALPGEASHFLLEPGLPLQFIALGPLTNLAAAILSGPERTADRVHEAIIVGSNATSAGRWPPFWPHEFNLTKDLRAARTVFDSKLSLTITPLDVAKRMTISGTDLQELQGDVGEYLREQSRRWFLRARLLKFSVTFPVWDLVAAMYALGEPSIRTEIVRATMHPNGWIEYGAGRREVRLIRDLDRDALWSRFVALINGHCGNG